MGPEPSFTRDFTEKLWILSAHSKIGYCQLPGPTGRFLWAHTLFQCLLASRNTSLLDSAFGKIPEIPLNNHNSELHFTEFTKNFTQSHTIMLPHRQDSLERQRKCTASGYLTLSRWPLQKPSPASHAVMQSQLFLCAMMLVGPWWLK